MIACGNIGSATFQWKLTQINKWKQPLYIRNKVGEERFGKPDKWP